MSGPSLICVERAGNAWRVRHDAVLYAPRPTKQAAIRQAVRLARKLGARGKDARVLIQRPNGDWATLWIYGRGPPPPGT